MSLSRRQLTLALALTPGIGGVTITRILTRLDLYGRSPEEFLTHGIETLTEEYRLKKSAAENWSMGQARWIKEALELQSRLDPFGLRLVTAADAGYPRLLELMDADPPGLLFLYGAHRLLEVESTAILSSRNSSTEAQLLIEATAERAVLTGQVIISGHNTPEYQRAAVVPLRWGAARILVLDQGHFTALGPKLTEEPFRLARLWRFQFDPRTDLVISPIHPDLTGHRSSPQVRDRLVAGLASRLKLIEVQPGGNMMRLAQRALRVGKPVEVSPLSPCFDTLRKMGAQPLQEK